MTLRNVNPWLSEPFNFFKRGKQIVSKEEIFFLIKLWEALQGKLHPQKQQCFLEFHKEPMLLHQQGKSVPMTLHVVVPHGWKKTTVNIYVFSISEKVMKNQQPHPHCSC